jgi:hypothetical protein
MDMTILLAEIGCVAGIALAGYSMYRDVRKWDREKAGK